MIGYRFLKMKKMMVCFPECFNTPSNKVTIRAVAFDGAGNSDTSFVNNIQIFIVYPSVLSVYPTANDYIDWYDQRIAVQFSRPMDFTTFDSSTISFTSKHSPLPSLEYEQESNSLIIGRTTGFASSDTISISMDASKIKSSFGYELNGVGGNNIDLIYKTTLYADYDTSSTIDDIDLVFVNGLETNDLKYELGPVLGVPLILIQDSIVSLT